jgi:hypothetical protein
MIDDVRPGSEAPRHLETGNKTEAASYGRLVSLGPPYQ